MKMASIIITNYNYERFLAQAVDSALNQTYSPVEVIVVDDGSTDGSRKIMERYGDKIISVFKANGGQASAFNAGFKRSRGDVIIFLDSDDVLFPGAVKNVMELFVAENIAKIHWPLCVMDERGIKTGELTPTANLPEGDFREHALRSGPPFFLNPPTSGNAWSRRFIHSVMPMPELEFRIGADTYLFEMSPFFGLIKRISEPQGGYRTHSRNNYCNKSFTDKLQSEIKFYDALFARLDDYCRRLGLTADPQMWRAKSWFHRQSQAVQDILELVPQQYALILVDDATWGIGDALEGRRILPFTEENGFYAGAPRDDTQAIEELKLMRQKGADYLFFAWPSFWWLDHYHGLHKHLRDHFNCVLDNERVIVFDLKGIS